MAYYDSSEGRRIAENKKAYEILMAELSKTDDGRKAHKHIISMAEDIIKLQTQVNEYKNFFNLLSKFLPKEFSIYDRLI